MKVSALFVEKTAEDSMLELQSRIAVVRPPKGKGKALRSKTFDYYAKKYTGKLVYIWNGPWKGRIGYVQSVSGKEARLSITGIGGSGIQTLKRANLIRCNNHS